MPNPSPTGSVEWTILRVIQWSTSYLRERSIDSPRAASEILLAHALGLERVQLYVQHDKPLEASELSGFKELIRRRIRRQPVAYIIGQKGFWNLDLHVEPSVLIPRPETEEVVTAALSELARYGSERGARVLDLGTGSGAIALAMASEARNHRYWACDISTAAVAVARRNAVEAGIPEKVIFFVADWFSALKPGQALFDLIVSNPPYVATRALAALPPEIVRYEPKLALDGGPDGLRSHAAIIEAAHRYLAPEGVLMLEIGYDQREAVQRLAAAAGHYNRFSCSKDYGGHDRVAIMHKK